MNSCLYKYELAAKLNISRQTLSTWLNGRYYHDLLKVGYYKTQKCLTPEQLKYLALKLGFEL